MNETVYNILWRCTQSTNKLLSWPHGILILVFVLHFQEESKKTLRITKCVLNRFTDIKIRLHVQLKREKKRHRISSSLIKAASLSSSMNFECDDSVIHEYTTFSTSCTVYTRRRQMIYNYEHLGLSDEHRVAQQTLRIRPFSLPT